MSKGQPVFSWIRKGHFIQSNVLAVHKLGPVEESEKKSIYGHKLRVGKAAHVQPVDGFLIQKYT